MKIRIVERAMKCKVLFTTPFIPHQLFLDLKEVLEKNGVENSRFYLE